MLIRSERSRKSALVVVCPREGDSAGALDESEVPLERWTLHLLILRIDGVLPEGTTILLSVVWRHLAIAIPLYLTLEVVAVDIDSEVELAQR